MQTFPLSYAKADALSPLLTKSVLSARGQIQVDARTNTLIIQDLPDRLATAQRLIGTLDMPQPQVEVEARVVQTTRDFARALGIQWGFNGRANSAIGNTTGLAFPNNGIDRRPGRRHAGRRPIRAAPAPASNDRDRGEPAGAAALVGDRPGARLDQRRVQPRRRADRAREHRQGARSSRRRG